MTDALLSMSYDILSDLSEHACEKLVENACVGLALLGSLYVKGLKLESLIHEVTRA